MASIIEVLRPESYNFLNLWSLPNGITAILFALLGIFVISKNLKEKINKLVILIIASAFWWQGWFFLAYNTENADAAYSLIKIGFFAVIFFSPLFFHSLMLLLGLEEKFKKMIYVNYAIFILMSALLFFTDLILGFPKKHFWGHYTTDGPFFGFFLVWFCVFLALPVFLYGYHLFFKKDSMDYYQKKRLKYIFGGTMLLVLASVDFLPNFGVEIYPFGFLNFLIFALILSYSIIKYGFLDIETAMHRTLAWLLVSFLLFLPVASILFLFHERLERFGDLWFSILLSILIIGLIKYHSLIQPRIDYLFRRKNYDLEKKALALTNRLSWVIKVDDLVLELNKEVCSDFYSKRSETFIKDNDLYANRVGLQEEIKLSEKNFLHILEKSDYPIIKEEIGYNPLYSEVKDGLLDWLENEGFVLLVPIRHGDTLLGFIALDKKDTLQPYTKDEIKILNNIGTACAVPLMNALKYEELIKKEIETNKSLAKFNKELAEKVKERTELLDIRDRELININKELEEANSQLKDLDIKKDEFISLAAHELKTPLTSIKGFSQLLLKDEIIEDKEKRKHYLELINKNTDRLYELILDLVDSSRISVGKLKMNIEDHDIYSVFSEIKENMTVIIKEKGIEPVFEIGEGLPKIRADQERLLQVLRNLIINAVHYTEKGSIGLKIQKENDLIRFEVKDTGQGIAKENQKSIFSRFYQADSSMTRKVGGSGLGLSVCKGLVELMGGKIWFESEPGIGTTFYFTIPATTDKPQLEAVAQVTA